MKVYGVEITAEQLVAAKAAMTGIFRASDIEQALRDTGAIGLDVISRGADRILQAERRAGHIQTNPLNKREWIRT
jgi:hypothetical protein